MWALKNLHLPPCLVKTLLPCLSGISLGQALRGVTVRGARQGQINSMNFDQNITTVRMCHKLCVFGAEFPPVLTLNSTTWEFILSSYFFLNIAQCCSFVRPISKAEGGAKNIYYTFQHYFHSSHMFQHSTITAPTYLHPIFGNV